MISRGIIEYKIIESQSCSAYIRLKIICGVPSLENGSSISLDIRKKFLQFFTFQIILQLVNVRNILINLKIDTRGKKIVH